MFGYPASERFVSFPPNCIPVLIMIDERRHTLCRVLFPCHDIPPAQPCILPFFFLFCFLCVMHRSRFPISYLIINPVH